MKMSYFIPTYEQALKIVNSNPVMTFFMTKHEVNGFDIHIFNYKLAFYKEFINPVDGENWKANEVRGLTFVFNKDGSLFKRYILLNKFFNINQNDETQFLNLKDLKIKSIHDKLDGSIVSFIKLPDNSIFAKSKGSFISDQSVEANEYYKYNAKLQNLVEWSLNNDITLIFELVSPKNKIVLDYKETKLVLLKLRNNSTGEFLNYDFIPSELLDGIDLPINETNKFSTLEDIVSLSKVAEDKEGWIIQFENDYLLKIKTEWYFKRHKLLTESLNREDCIIDLILNEKIDDVISQLGDSEVDVAKKDWVLNIQSKVNMYISLKIVSLNKKIKDFTGDKKSFVLNYHTDKEFSLLMKLCDGKDVYDVVKNDVFRKTKALVIAKEFLEKIK